MGYRCLSFAVAVAVCSTLASAGQYSMSVPAAVTGSARVRRVVSAWNRAVGGGCRIDLGAKRVSVAVSREGLPHSVREAEKDVREFVGELSPDMREHGLLLPAGVENAKGLVVLVHGLDCDGQNFVPLAEKLQGAGYAVVRFNYPDDQPIADSAALFARELERFRARYPGVKVSVVAHSMGGLVARGAIEGPDYSGGVDHLILLAPPNHGTGWAALHFVSEAEEQWRLYRNDPWWRWSWAVTDGLGEGARDLLPKSDYLKELNARPRRAGVKYTIIAGTEFPAQSCVADALDAAHLGTAAGKVRGWASGSDGPVSVASARLTGVSDFVTLPVDHTELYYGWPPAAWGVIRERLLR